MSGPDPDAVQLPVLTDAVEKLPAMIGFSVEEAFWAYSRLGIATLAAEHHDRIAVPLTQSTRTLDQLADPVDAAPSS
jgi:hypothetical protein